MGLRSAIVCVAVGMVATVAAAADLRPSWECLPADTAVMVRVPGARAFWETLQKQTKFGSVALRPERLESLWKILSDAAKTEGDDSLEDLEESLRKDGLELADLAKLFDGEIGMGIVAHARKEQPPVPLLLAWVEPGEEVAQKLLASMQRQAEESDEEPRTKRIDLELAGHTVTTFAVPVTELDVEEFEMDAEDEDLDEAAIESRLEAHVARLKESRLKKTGERHVLVTVVGGRLLIGAGNVKLDKADGGDEAEELRRVFGMFLEAHSESGESALAPVLREPGIAAATLPGTPLFEALVAPAVLMAAAEHDVADLRSQLAKVGLDDLGGVVQRVSFHDGRWRSVMAMTMPSPRHGVFQMLDQPCDASEVPAFVTRETADFTQLSLDLGAAYKAVRQLLLEQADGEQVANMFSVADIQSQAWLGVDVATVLSGLGSRHWFLTFPPNVAEAMARARADEKDGESEVKLADRMAIVWQVADDAPYLKLVGRLAQLAGGQLEDEQGFEGVRMPGGAAFYVGRGHLVIALGEGTLEKTLAAIRTPPQGDTSLRESDVPQRAAELLPARPARMYAVSDSTRTAGTLGTLRDLAASLEADDIDEEFRSAFVALKALLPTAREMEGMFGIGAALLRMTDDGLLYESCWEMPAP